MPPRPFLSDEEAREEREDRNRLRALDARLDALHRQREPLFAEMHRLGGEQRALYDRRQAPQETVERLYREHSDLGRRIAELRSERDRARTHLDQAVIAMRELRLEIGRGERVRPDNLRREIAELELRQQTRALTLEEENALIAQLRARARALKEAEARADLLAENERRRKAAEEKVAEARAQVEALGKTMAETRATRDAKMTEIRSTLESAGALVAQMRAKGKERAELMGRADAIGREIADLEREGRKILGAARTRRDRARRTARTYMHHNEPAEDALASAAEAQLEELLKRGRVTLGGSS